MTDAAPHSRCTDCLRERDAAAGIVSFRHGTSLRVLAELSPVPVIMGLALLSVGPATLLLTVPLALAAMAWSTTMDTRRRDAAHATHVAERGG
jgi:hypothetical protein